MKRLRWFVLVMGLLLAATGCGAEKIPDSEEHDCVVQDENKLPRYDISMAIPADAPEIETFRGDCCRVYAQKDGEYYLTVQTLQAESLDDILLELTGKQKNTGTMVTTWQQGMPRHDLNWVSAGEAGLEVNRAAIIDDGSHYYTIILTVTEEMAAQINQQIADCFSGIRLIENLDTGLIEP